MARPEKVAVVDEIKEKLESSGAVFITEYRGLSVSQQQELRRKLRATGTEYKVMKMSLARLAAEGADKSDLLEWLQGPTALAFTDDDPVIAAKELKTFAAGNEFLVIKGGLLDGETLDQEAVGKLADLEPREVLLAMFAGALKAPLTKLAGLMSAVLRQPASAMQQLLEKKTAAGPAEEAVPDETQESEEAAVEDSSEETAVEGALDETAAEASADGGAEEAPADETAEEGSKESPEDAPAEDAADEPSDAGGDKATGSEDDDSKDE